MTYSCKKCSYKCTKEIAKLEKISIDKLKAKSKGFCVSWKKVSSATFYQIQYSISSDFSNAKTVTVKDNTVISKNVTGLKSNKKYFVRIRFCKTISQTNCYSSWSAVKTVTTK